MGIGDTQRLSLAERAGRERALLARARKAAAPASIPRRPDPSAPCALSFAQQRLWFLDRFERGGHYNIPAAFRIRGPFDAGAAEAALQALVSRHEALRTRFETAPGGGDPVQIVCPSGLLRLELRDLSGNAAGEREVALESLLRKEAERPFDLSRTPLIRALLMRVAEGEHILLLVVHHIAADGWTMGVLMNDWAALYDGIVSGRPAELPDLPLQYADYAFWERGRLQGELLEAEIAYWRERLAGLPPLSLPLDHPRPPLQTFRGRRLVRVMPARLLEQLRALGSRSDATLFMLLLAAWQALLGRYSQQEDFAAGTVMSNRTRLETERIAGLFLNTLVMRADLSGNPPFRTLLARVRNSVLDAWAHQELPFEKLVEELRPERAPNRTPLFQVMFVLQNLPGRRRTPEGLEIERIELETSTAKFDLTLTLAEQNGLRAALIYNTDLFEEATINRMLGHFHVLLEGIAANPDQRLSDMPLLSDEEREQVLVRWNATASDFSELAGPGGAVSPRHRRGWLGLFQRRARKRPDEEAPGQ